MIEEASEIKATDIVMCASKSMELEDQKVSEERLKNAIKEKFLEISSKVPKYLWD